MEQEVYVDLYFLINTCMDLLCLMLTAALLHRYIKRWKAVLSAAAGGLYALFSLFWGLGGVFGFLCDVAVAVGMCSIVFGSKKTPFYRLLMIGGVYLLVSMIMGGVMTALYAWLNRLHLPLDALDEDSLSVWIFALLAAVASFATAWGGKLLGFAQKTKSVRLDLTLFGKDVTLTALVDSGNLLRDPLSGKSVIAVRREALSGVLPPRLLRICESGKVDDWLMEYEHAKKLRIIPVETAAGSTLLPAFLPEKLTVTSKKERYDADYLVAVADLGKQASGFDALIALH